MVKEAETMNKEELWRRFKGNKKDGKDWKNKLEATYTFGKQMHV